MLAMLGLEPVVVSMVKLVSLRTSDGLAKRVAIRNYPLTLEVILSHFH